MSAPIDDEREAQGWREANLYDVNSVSQDDFMAGWRTADRLRHSEVPEPSDPEGDGSSPWKEIQAAKDLLAEAYGPGEWSSEPQGEPSDAEVEAALEAWAAHADPRDPEGAMRAALRAAGGVR